MGSSAWASAAILLLATVAAPTQVSASVIPIGVGAFGPGSTLTTFTGLVDGTEVNGLTVDAILFSYSLGNGNVITDGGPDVTNEITPPNIVSIGDNTGTLTMLLPSLVDSFGYGYAVLTTRPLAAATTISLFNGVTPVGSLSYAGSPDPVFTGGFAGIQSTLAFNRVDVTFDSAAAPAFALDNIRTAITNAEVPEPGTLLLLSTGAAFLMRRRRAQHAPKL